MQISKHKKISSILSERIANGFYADKLPGKNVLAQEFNVAAVTMAKAMHSLADDGLVYTKGSRGTFIRKNQRKKTNVIGWVTTYFTKDSIFEQEIISRISKEHNYDAIFLQTHSLNKNNIADSLSSMMVDGFVFQHVSLTPEIAEVLYQQGIPFVSINRIPDIPHLECVDYDNVEELDRALDYLTDMGHKRIACIFNNNPVPGFKDSLFSCFEKNMQEKGEFIPEFFYTHGYTDSLREKGAQLAAEFLMAHPTPPTAAILQSPFCPETFRKTLEKYEVKIPDNFSLIYWTTEIWVEELEAERKFFTRFAHNYDMRVSESIRLLENIAENNIQKQCFVPVKRRFIIEQSCETNL
jgi:DNA-binding LacI/PurR family transcriptional regulator